MGLRSGFRAKLYFYKDQRKQSLFCITTDVRLMRKVFGVCPVLLPLIYNHYSSLTTMASFSTRALLLQVTTTFSHILIVSYLKYCFSSALLRFGHNSLVTG